MIRVENSAPESVVNELVRFVNNMSSVTGETIEQTSMRVINLVEDCFFAAIEKEKNRR